MSDEIFDLSKCDVDGVDIFNKGQYYRLRKWEDSSVGGNRNLDYALGELEKFSSKLGVFDDVRVESVRVYESAVDAKVLRGRSVELVIACCVYIGCRLAHAPFSVVEVAEVCGVGSNKILKVSKVICKAIGVRLPLVRAVDYVERYCNVLGLSDRVVERARVMCKEADECGLVNGKSPATVVSGVLYLSALLMGEKRTQRDVADVCGVSDVALRKYIRLLREELSLPL